MSAKMSPAIDRVLIVPRWSGTSKSDSYPWLLKHLEERFGRRLSARALDMPNPSTPRIDTWPPFLLGELGEDPEILRKTLLIGHSVGCQAVLRALAALPQGCSVSGVVLLAAWFRVDKPWETILPWMELDYDFNKVRASAPWFDVLLSDNDPFTADYQETAAEYKARLGANVIVVPQAKHFNASEEPALLETVVRRIEGS